MSLNEQTLADTRTVSADESLKAWAVSRWLAGADYRDLWSTPIEVEVLDLQSFAGGLKPEFRVGGQQTIGLAMSGNDGRSYTFRGVVKDLSSTLPEDFREHLIDNIVQDQLAAAHPVGSLIVPRLAEAAGVLHTTPRLILMPDDAALGEFRETFAGLLGTIQEYPTKASADHTGFQGAIDIVSTDDLWQKLITSPQDRVDIEAFLRARLLDYLIGDWDRHARQWRWAKLPGQTDWRPIPEDRDQAFSSYEGFIPALFRPYQPKFVRFDDQYPRKAGLAWQGWQIHRWLLVELDRTRWVRAASDLRDRLTDEAIDTAVRQMPRAYFDKVGEEIARKLKVRRDHLPEFAEKMYAFHASEADVHATNQDEHIELRALGNGDLELTVALENDVTNPYFRRRFNHKETSAVRVYLHNGRDTVTCDGSVSQRIKIEVIGNKATDHLGNCGSALRFTDSDEIELRQEPIRERPNPSQHFSTKKEKAAWARRRDWGSRIVPIYEVGLSSDRGLVLGGGVSIDRYQFGKAPYGHRHTLTGAYSSGLKTGRLAYQGAYQFWNPRVLGTLNTYVSGLDQARFYGFGNETVDDADNDFFKTEITAYVFEPAINYVISPGLETFFSGQLKFTSTDENTDTLLNQLQPYGVGEFRQFGLRGGFDYDTRDRTKVYGPGVHLRIQGLLVPETGDVISTFGNIEAELAGFASLSERLMFSARVAGKNVFGTFPFQEAAYIGGSHSLRGYFEDRFAGDSSVVASAEFRYTLGYASALFFRGEWGVFAFGDAGRVWVDGEDSDEWHPTGGGGVSVSTLERSVLGTLSIAKSDERTTFYFLAGFSY